MKKLTKFYRGFLAFFCGMIRFYGFLGMIAFSFFFREENPGSEVFLIVIALIGGILGVLFFKDENDT